jgi:hypothetical protein
MLKKFIKIVPALTSLVFLASCHAEALSSPSGDSTQDSVSPVISSQSDNKPTESNSSVTPKESLYDKVKPLLTGIVRKKNFTLHEKDDNGGDVSYIYTSSYIAGKTSVSTRGYIEVSLPNQNTIVRNFRLLPGDDFSLGEVLVSQGYAVSTISSLFSYFDNIKELKDDSFVTTGKEVVSLDSDLVSAFASLLVDSTNTNKDKIKEIHFALGSEANSLLVSFKDENGDAIEGIEKREISSIGVTSIKSCDYFLKNYSIPTDTLSSLTGFTDNLIGDSFASSGLLSLEEHGKEAEDAINLYKTSYQVNTSKRVASLMDATSDEVLSSSYIQKEEDKTYSLGINGKNEVVKQEVSYAFDKLDSRKSVVNNDDFRKTGENEYTYYGIQYDNLYYVLTGNEFTSVKFASATLTLEENKVSHVTFYSGYIYAKLEGAENPSYYRYKLDLTISANETIEDFKPLEIKDTRFETMVNTLTKSDRNYKVVDSDSGSAYHNEWYVSSDMIVKKVVSSTTSYEGYLKTENGLASFSVNGDTVLLNGELDKDGSLDDKLPWKASPSIFEAYGTSDAVLRSEVFADAFLPYVFADNYVKQDGVYIQNLSLHLNENNTLASMSFSYADSVASGDMKLTYTYGEGSLPADLDQKIRNYVANNTYVAPTSFAGSSGALSLLKGIKFTDEEIADIPFLAKKEYDTQWAGYKEGDGYTKDTNFVRIRIPDTSSARASAEADTTFFEDYKTLLTNIGFTSKSETLSNGWGGSTTFTSYSYAGTDETLKAKYQYIKFSFDYEASKSKAATPADGFIIFNTDPNDISSPDSGGDWGDWGY